MNEERLRDFQSRIGRVLSCQLFFIAGAPKSGTTWVQRLLDAHPEIVCSGEGHFADKIAAPLSDLFKAYNKHQALVSERVYENKAYYSGLKQEYFDFVVLSLACLIMAQRPISETVKCIGDKTPRYTFFLEHLGNLFPTAKFIHVIRDGRDVVVSLCHHAFRAGDKEAVRTNSPEFLKHTETFAKAWADNVRAARRFGKAHPDRYREVRYEDLHENPDSAIGGLLEFLGVSVSQDLIRRCKDSAEFRRWSGGRDKGEEDKTSFFRKGLVGDWKSYFNDASFDVFRKQTDDLLEELGYF